MGASTDLVDENLRRLIVNAVYMLVGLDVPAKVNVDIVGEYKPTDYGFRKDTELPKDKPEDFAEGARGRNLRVGGELLLKGDVAICLIGVLSLCSGGLGDVRYGIMDNCPQSAEVREKFAINDAGDVVGTYFWPHGPEHAFLFSGGVFTDLGKRELSEFCLRHQQFRADRDEFPSARRWDSCGPLRPRGFHRHHRRHR